MGNSTNFIRGILLAVLMIFVPQGVFAEGKLQKVLDELSLATTRVTGDVQVLDLSKFSDAEKMLSQTLEFRNGLHVKVINGEITRTAEATGPMVRVSNNSVLELGEGAFLHGNGRYHGDGDNTSSPVVEVSAGKLLISSGVIDSDEKTSHPNRMISFSWKTDCSVLLNSATDCQFEMAGGKITDGFYAATKSATISLMGGTVEKVNHEACISNVDVLKDGKCNLLATLDFPNSNRLYLLSAEQYNISFWAMKVGVVYVEGKSYQLTKDDLEHISGESQINELVLCNNQVMLKRRSLVTVDDLQAKIDEIAVAGNTSANNKEQILLSSYGMTINKRITIPQNCYVDISGGPLKICPKEKESLFFDDDMVFDVSDNSGLSLHDISVDFNNSGGYGSLFKLDGQKSTVYIGEQVTFDNCVPSIVDGPSFSWSLASLAEGSTFVYSSGEFCTENDFAIEGRGNVTIKGGRLFSNGSTIRNANCVTMYGGVVDGSGNSSCIVVPCIIYADTFDFYYGTVGHKELENGGHVAADVMVLRNGTFLGKSIMLTVGEKCNITATEFSAQPRIYLYESDATLELPGVQPLYEYSVYALWNKDFYNKPIVNGIVDPKFVTFDSLPDDVEPYFDKERKSISLVNEIEDANTLQGWLDNLSSGDIPKDEEVELPIPSGGVDADGTIEVGKGLQWVLDGMGTGKESKPFYVGVNTNITIISGTTLTLRNLNILSKVDKEDNGYIYVSGTLIIGININITRIHRLIRVLPGGKVIWKGGNGEGTDITKEFIYVEKDGKLEYRGGTITGGEYGFHGLGTIYIYDGTIGGTTYGGYTYPSGTTYIYGGNIIGNYYNGGATYIYGCSFGSGNTTVSDGKGNIYNAGNLYVGGDSNFSYGNIYNEKTGKIYIIGKLNVIIRIHINITDIYLDSPIVMGADGYVLTEDDLKKIQIILPDGYLWKYDATLGGIIITTASGVETLASDKVTAAQYYDASGRIVKEVHKGLNIVRTSDGNVRKIVVK